MSFAEKQMELEVIMLGERSQAQNHKYHMSSFMWNIDLKMTIITKIMGYEHKKGTVW
jgi:uncharacterized membrane protein